MKTKEIINELLVSAVANKVSDIFFFPKEKRQWSNLEQLGALKGKNLFQ